MANASTKAMSNDEWLKEKGKDGTLTFVSGTNGANDDKVAWSDTDPSAPHAGVNSGGQTYRQGTIHNIGGSQYESGGSAIYDGAQNLIGYVAGDGTVFRTGQDKDGRLTVDSEGLSDYDRQYLQSAADRLRQEGALSGMGAQDVVDQMNANKASGRLSAEEIAAREAEKAYALSAAGGGAWTNPNYAGRDEDGGGGRGNPIDDLYAAQQKAALAALEGAYNQSLIALGDARNSIEPDYYEAERQVTGTNDRERQNMNEQFAALGLNTGARGQAALAQNNVYQGQIGALEKAKADALSDVELQRAQLTAEYQSAVAQAIANNELEKAQALYNEYVRQDTAAQERAAQIQQQAQSAQQQAQSAGQKLAQSQVDAMLKAGTMPSASLLAQAGYSQEYADALIAQRQAQPRAAAPAADTVTSVAQLGQTARNLYSSLASGEVNSANIANAMRGYLASGRITEAEANYLLDIIGAK